MDSTVRCLIADFLSTTHIQIEVYRLSGDRSAGRINHHHLIVFVDEITHEICGRLIIFKLEDQLFTTCSKNFQLQSYI